jgi:pimeloyl-ACP methyl ester carboxylesterase
MHIVFSHGQDGEPWGSKIVAMADVAKRHELQVDSVDYRGMADPAERVAKLLQHCTSNDGPFILVGSSMGGHVAAAVASQVSTRGLFLLAPAFFMPGYEQYTPVAPQCRVEIVHGWNDTIVPIDNSIRYARQYKCALHILDSDHRLTAQLDEICELFDTFLTRLTRRNSRSGP